MSNYEELAKRAAGNWQQFDSFAWHVKPPDSEQWTIVSLRSRDSGLLDQSNAAAIAAELAPFESDGTVIFQRFHHWGFGWVEAVAVRVYHDGKVTAAFERLCELHAALDSYPVLDDDDFSRREYETTLENIESQAGRYVDTEKAPDNWTVRLFSWFWDNDPKAVEPFDGGGGWPSGEQCKAAVAALGWLCKEEENDDETA